MTDRDLFIAALDKHDSTERDAWLDQVCAGDPDRRRRVGVLLRAHDEASQFLAAPAADPLAAGPAFTDAPTRDAHPAANVDVLALLAPADEPGQLGRLDHYEVLKVVGKGGMGVVLKAFDPKLHRLVAVKLMAPHLAAHAAARRRFEREARAVAAVRNDHVVAIHGVEPGGPTPYLVMEFVGGVSLQDRLEQRGPPEVKEILRIGMQAARGLAAAHAQGLVHRDVKPANILLENGVERVKITDFGLARAADDANLTQSGVITGTPNYMSPEQAAGSPVDPRSDLFSLGSVLYALCTGHPPFRAATPLGVLRRVCDDPARPVREVNPDIPGWLGAVVQKLLAKNPGDRFQTATEVADLLGRYLAHLQQPNVAPMPAGVSPPAHSPRYAPLGCFVAVFVLVGLVVFEFLDGGPEDSAPPGHYSPVYVALCTVYMLLSSGVILLVDLWGRLQAKGRWHRLLWTMAIATVVAGTTAGLLALWGGFGPGQSGIRPEVWHLLGICSGAVLVNLPVLFRSFLSSRAAGLSAKSNLPPIPVGLARAVGNGDRS